MYTVGGNIGGEDWYSYITENHIVEEQFKHNYTPLFHDVHLDENYTGSHRYNNSGINCSVTNTQVINDEN